MTNKTVNSTIELLGKFYPIRCVESELKSLQQAAEYLNQKMIEVQASGTVINPERIAIVTALNITYEFLQLGEQKLNLVNRINQRVSQLQDKLDMAINKNRQTELVYTSE